MSVGRGAWKAERAAGMGPGGAGWVLGLVVLCGCSSSDGTGGEVDTVPDVADDAGGGEDADGAGEDAGPDETVEEADDGGPPEDGAPPDDDPPRLYSARSESSTGVRLVFNEPLAADANNRRNFRITPTLWIERVAFGASAEELYLTTDPQINGQLYDIEVVRVDTNSDGIIDGRDNILTDVARNPIDPDFARAEFTGISQEVYAIVDVMVSDNAAGVPADYTGISWDGCTDPFVPGELGTRVAGSDVNSGIGGSTTTIWVKYERVPVTSSRAVLTGIAATSWDYGDAWAPTCPGGWVRANGTSSGIQGALTTGTEGDCWRIGVCVRYATMSSVSSFITNLSFSWPDEEPDCPAVCAANEGWWPMFPDELDIHRGCGDDQWLRICSNRALVAPPMPPTIDATDAEKVELLGTYAPRVWLSGGETFYPASVDWAFPFLERYVDPDGNYRLRTRAAMSSPSDSTLTVFHGNPALAETPVYAFWKEKNVGTGTVRPEVADLIYFTYYPYNRGKLITPVDTVFGNHVGDWEHVSVRLTWQYFGADGWRLTPTMVYISAHSFGFLRDWGPMAKADGTHIVVYGANGSHGLWPDAGSHVFEDYSPAFTLADDCDAGTPWDTWNRLVSFDFDLRLGLGGATWPTWMGTEFTAPGTGPDPSDPWNGAIYRWGNEEWDCYDLVIPFVGDFGRYCRLETGPTGPVSKGMWISELLQ